MDDLKNEVNLLKRHERNLKIWLIISDCVLISMILFLLWKVFN